MSGERGTSIKVSSKIHPVTNDLLIATHGRGIMIVDDISPIRNLTKEIIEKDVMFLRTNR